MSRNKIKKMKFTLGAVITSVGVLLALSPLSVVADSVGDVSSWTASSNTLPQGVQDATSVVNDGYVYVMGGDNNGGVLNTVYYAQLSSNGTVGTWNTSPSTLPQALDDATSVVDNGYVYVIGGVNSASPLNTVYYAQLNANGSVGSWTTSSSTLPQGIRNATSVISNGYVYVMGGENNSGYVNTVYYAQLSSNGSVGTWTTSTSTLPQVLYKPTSVIYNGYVDVMGGETTGSSFPTTVYYAQLNTNGTVATWNTSTSTLPQGSTNATSVTYNGYVYFMGGNAVPFQNGVDYAALNSTGGTGAWSTSPNSLPQALKGATSVTYNGYVYVLGGEANGTVFLNTVYYASFVTTIPTSNTTIVNTTPDTGYGLPTQSGPIISLGIVSALMIATGSLLFYGTRKSNRSLD